MLAGLSSITLVHSPLVPAALDDDDAWARAATPPTHAAALTDTRLRRWLHCLSHSRVASSTVHQPRDLEACNDHIFFESVRAAENALGNAPALSEKETAALIERTDAAVRRHDEAVRRRDAAVRRRDEAESRRDEAERRASTLEAENAALRASLRHET